MFVSPLSLIFVVLLSSTASTTPIDYENSRLQTDDCDCGYDASQPNLKVVMYNPLIKQHHCDCCSKTVEPVQPDEDIAKDIREDRPVQEPFQTQPELEREGRRLQEAEPTMERMKINCTVELPARQSSAIYQERTPMVPVVRQERVGQYRAAPPVLKNRQERIIQSQTELQKREQSRTPELVQDVRCRPCAESPYLPCC